MDCIGSAASSLAAMRQRVNEAARIAKLQGVLRLRKREVELLQQQHSLLHFKWMSTALALMHCDGLLQLGDLLHGGAGAMPPWQSQVMELKQHLGSGSGNDMGTQLEEVASCPDWHLPPELGLRWSPEAAARAAMAADLSPAGMHAKIQSMLQQFSGPMIRVLGGAPDAAAAEELLDRLRADALEHMILTAIRDFSVISSMALAPVHCGSGCGTQGSGPPLPTEEHWMWAAQQLALDEDQMELIIATLDSWAARVKHIQQRRQQLIAELPKEGNKSTEIQDDLLHQINNAMRAGSLNFLTCYLSVFASILRPIQFACYISACSPWVPSLLSVHSSLRRLKRKGEQDESE